jgi:hypothetical protein
MVEGEILKGAIVIIEDDRFRVRELPILKKIITVQNNLKSLLWEK